MKGRVENDDDLQLAEFLGKSVQDSCMPCSKAEQPRGGRKAS